MHPTPPDPDGGAADRIAEFNDRLVNLAYALGLTMDDVQRQHPGLADALSPIVDEVDHLIHVLREFTLSSALQAMRPERAAATTASASTQPSCRPVPRRGSRHGTAGDQDSGD